MQRALPEKDSCVDWLESIMYRPNACHLDQRVANRLIALSSNGMAKTTAVEIGRAIRVSDRTVRAVLSRLAKEGFIFASKVDRRTNLRTITLNLEGEKHNDRDQNIINTSTHLNGSPSLTPSISETGLKPEELPVDWSPSDWFDTLEAWGCLHLLPSIEPSLRRKWGKVFQDIKPSEVSAGSLRGGCTAKNAIVVALEELFSWDGETPTVHWKHKRKHAAWGSDRIISTSRSGNGSGVSPTAQGNDPAPQEPQTAQSVTLTNNQGHGQPKPTQAPQNVALNAEKEDEWDEFLSQFGEKVSNARYVMRQNWPLFVEFVNTYSPSQLNPPFVESLRSDSLNRKMSYLCKQLSRKPDGTLKVERIVLKPKPKARPKPPSVRKQIEEEYVPPSPEMIEQMARLARGDFSGLAKKEDQSHGNGTTPTPKPETESGEPLSREANVGQASSTQPGGGREASGGHAPATRTFDRGRIEQMLRERFLSGAQSDDLEGDS